MTDKTEVILINCFALAAVFGSVWAFGVLVNQYILR